MIGGSEADVLVGRASTRASYESALSKRLRPPVRWSYRKLIFWSALIFVCGGWLIFYVNTTSRNATTVTSPALTAYASIAAVVFAVLLALVVRHNHGVDSKRFAEWEQSFICQRCGTVSQPHSETR